MLSIVENNGILLEHGGRLFFQWNFSVIFICPSCVSYFKSLYQAQNFCFQELRKCLSEKYLREGENLTFPTEFQRLI